MRLDPGSREEKLVQCFKRWMPLDPDGARAWLERNKIADDLKQRCLAAAPAAH